VAPKIERAQPPYMQVAAHIREKIAQGELGPGDVVPSVREIAATWGVARATAEKALAALKNDGLVGGQPGVGTVVLPAPLYQTVQDRYGSVRRTGRIYPPGQHAKILAAELVPAPDDVVRALQLDAGAQVIRRRRVTYNGEDRPIASSTSWFAGELAGVAPKLLERERILQGTAAYVEQATGRMIRYAEDEVYARLATSQEAAELDLAEPAAVLVTEHTAWDTADQPLTYEVGLAPAGYRHTSGYEVQLREGDQA
jgi:DNA-binding GntR family transcriptional regulator